MAKRPRKPERDIEPEDVPEHVENSYVVGVLMPDEHEGDVLEDVPEGLANWFRVATNPPLTKEAIDELSHVICDYLIAIGYRNGFTRVVQDHTRYERGEVDVTKWLVVQRGQRYEDRKKDYGENTGGYFEEDSGGSAS